MNGSERPSFRCPVGSASELRRSELHAVAFISFVGVLEDLITVESRGLEPTETRVCKGEKSWWETFAG